MNPNKQFCIGKIINLSLCKSQANALDQKGTKRFNTSGNQTQISRAARYSQALNQPTSVATRILNDPVIFEITSVTISEITTSSSTVNYEGYYNQVIIQRNGVQIYKGSAIRYFDTGLEPNTLYTYTVTSCKTDTVIGYSSSSSAVTLPTLTSVSFSNIAAYSVTINYEGKFYGVIIKRNGTQIYSGTDASFNDTGVSPYTSYLYEVIPYNINNLTNTSISDSVTTLPVITSLSYSDISLNSLKVNWTGVFNSAIVNRNGTQIYSGSDTSFNDTGLTINTLYNYQVIPYRADNVAGVDLSSNIATLPILTSLTYSDISLNSIKVNWTGIFNRVVVNRNGSQIYSGSNTSFNDTSLAVNTSYTYQVIPYNINNVAGVDISSSIVTLPYLDSISFSNIAAYSVTINYQGSFYGVFIKRDGTQIYNGTDTSFNDISLNANTLYSYEVIPYNINNLINTSVTNSVTTANIKSNIYTFSSPIYFTNINCYPYTLTTTANAGTNILTYDGKYPCNKYFTSNNSSINNYYVRFVDNNGYYYDVSSATTNTVTLKQNLLSSLISGQIVLVQNVNLVSTDTGKYTTGYLQSRISNYPQYSNSQVIACSKNGKYITIVSVNKIFVSSNFGSSFTSTDTSYNMVAVAMNSSGQYQIACSDNMPGCYTFYSTNYGVNWNSFVTSLSPGNMGRYNNSCSVSSTGQYMISYAGGTSGNNTTYYSSNYGDSFSRVLNYNVSNFSRCSVLINDASLNSYTCGDITNIGFNFFSYYTFSNGTQQPNISLTFTPQTICANGTSIFTTDVNYGYYSSSYTTSFTNQGAIPEKPILFTSYINNNLYACSYTTLYISTDNGLSWSTYSNITSSGDPIYAMTASSTNDHSYIYFITNGGNIYSVFPI